MQHELPTPQPHTQTRGIQKLVEDAASFLTTPTKEQTPIDLRPHTIIPVFARLKDGTYRVERSRDEFGDKNQPYRVELVTLPQDRQAVEEELQMHIKALNRQSERNLEEKVDINLRTGYMTEFGEDEYTLQPYENDPF